MLSGRVVTTLRGEERASDDIPPLMPPFPSENHFARDLPWRAAFVWLRKGWSDLLVNPAPSLTYGLIVFTISVAVVWSMFALTLDYVLFQSITGIHVIGPIIASGLYEKSRRIENGERISLAYMLVVRPRSTTSALFMGAMLLGLLLLWMRAAVIIYAVFFGLLPFPGTDALVPMLLTTPAGWALLLTGSVVGALFAAFAFAISVFAIPMLLTERIDALTAMGLSVALTWNNLPVMLTWGAIVVVLFALSLATGFIGLIVVFPLLGHATWHAYRAIRRPAQSAQDDPMLLEQDDGANNGDIR